MSRDATSCGPAANAPQAEPGRVTLPRLFTAPLVTGPPGPCGCGCALTPDTSDGFDVAAWAADVLHAPLRGWQRWLLIHGLELAAGGRPRFPHRPGRGGPAEWQDPGPVGARVVVAVL